MFLIESYLKQKKFAFFAMPIKTMHVSHIYTYMYLVTFSTANIAKTSKLSAMELKKKQEEGFDHVNCEKLVLEIFFLENLKHQGQ